MLSFIQLANYQEKYLETDKILKEREASLGLTKDGVVAELEATIADLERQLQLKAMELKTSIQPQPTAAKANIEGGDAHVQQR